MGFIAAPYVEKRNPLAPKHWDRGWRAAIAAGATTPVRFLVIGDSISQGQYANSGGSAPAGYDYRADGWVDKVVRGLLTKYGGAGLVDGAEWFSPLTESNLLTPTHQTAQYVSTAGTGLPPFSSPSASASTKQADSNGWWRQVYFTRVNTWSAVGDELLRFNPPAGTKRVDVVWEGHTVASGGTFKVNTLGTPGTGDQTVTVSYTSLGGNVPGDVGEPQMTTVYDSVNALTQPVLLGNQSASSVMKILGCLAYLDTSKGLQHGRLAYGGRTFGEAVQVASALRPTDKLESLFGLTDGYTAFPRTPHLTILAAGTNDNNRNVSGGLSLGPAGYRAALERTIGAIRATRTDASIMILLPWHSSDFSDQPNQVSNSSWGAFLAAAEAVARIWTCAFVDFTALWEPTPAADGYVAGDAHPTAEGYTFMADTVLGLL